MMSRLLSIIVFSFITMHANAFFFGGGGGGGCSCAAAPACAPPPSCPIAPPVAPCIPQSGCGGGGFGGSYGGGSYASPSISYGPQSFAGAPKGGYASAGQQYIRTPQLGSSYASGPAIGSQPPLPTNGASGYSNGPVGGPQQVQVSTSSSYSSGPRSGSSVQVPAASYAGQAAAGQKLQEVEDDLDEQMMAEAKAEDATNQEASLSSSSSATLSDHVNLSSENGTLEVVKAIDISQLSLTNNTECNSEDLRKIILDNIDEDLNSSKRVIQLSAEAKFGGRFDVICSNNDFSYVTNTELYCQETKQQVSCYAYRQL